MKILIIEDDRRLARTIRDELRESYIVELAFTGEEAQFKIEINEYDLLILDISLPDTSGIKLCQLLRRKGLTTPILMLTGALDIHNKVAAFDSGADDYLTKPFNIEELYARIRALLRRPPTPPISHTQQIADLKIDTISKTATRQGKDLQLRRKEFDILEHLIRNAGKTVTRQTLINHLWSSDFDAVTNIVDVHIKHLRDKVDKPFTKKLIRTVHGMGYKIEE